MCKIRTFALLTALLLGSLAQAHLHGPHDHGHDHGPDHGRDHAMIFIRNAGQWDDAVRYKADVLGATAFLENNGITFVKLEDRATQVMHDAAQMTEEERMAIRFKGHAWHMGFINPSAAMRMGAGHAAPYYHNYFLGNDPSRWAGHVPIHDEVRYNALWPGVDMVLRSHEGHLKYDLLVAPGTDPGVIGFRYEGMDKLSIGAGGELVLGTSVGEMVELRPVVFHADGDREPIACNYVLQGNELRFVFPQGYDRTRPVVIDPILVAGTYSGATGSSNYGHCAAFDGFGNIFTGARNFGPTYPATLGAFQTSFGGGGTDISLSKYNPDGSQLIWAAYMGGSSGENPHSLIGNNAGELIVLGTTNSANFPITPGAFDATIAGQDITVTRISADGSTLLGSTFVGGSAGDGTNGITGNYGETFRGEVYLDAVGNIVVASFTNSTDFPVTTGAFQPTLGGNQDGVVFKLDPTCSNLLASTYIGGSAGDAAMGLRVLGNGDILVTGHTASNNFPVTAGAYQANYQGGSTDAWVARFSSDLTSMVAGTFFGTSSMDRSYFIDTDSEGAVWIYGQTDGQIPIQPAGIFGQPGGRIFVAKLDADLATAPISSVFGTTGSGTVPVAFLVDVCDQIYLSGFNSAANLPLTADALYTTGSFYLSVFNANMDGQLFGTYYGGSHVDGGTSRFDKNGIVYQGVCSGGNSMQSAPWAYAPFNNIGWDIAVFKIDMEQIGVLASVSASASDGCAPATIDFNANGAADEFIWDFGDGSGTVSGVNASYTFESSGVYTVMLVGIDSASCNIADTAYVTITISDPAELLAQFTAEYISTCDGYGVQLTNTSTGGTSFVWDLGGGQQSTQPDPYVTVPGPGDFNFTITLFDPLCQDTTSASMMVTVPPAELEIELDSPVIICPGGSALISAGIGFDAYLWSTGETAAIITVETEGEYSVVVTEGFCTATDTVVVVVAPIPASMEDVTTCPGLPVLVGPTFPTTSILWSTGSEQDTIAVDMEGFYWFTALDDYGCTVVDSVEVRFLPSTEGEGFVPNVFTPNGDGMNDVFQVDGLGLQDFSMQIYNRWGQILFETTNVQNGWNGGVDNQTSQRVPEGTYYYIITYKDLCATEPDTKKVGHVTVLR
jgi:gliding motility-associated-like protein